MRRCKSMVVKHLPIGGLAPLYGAVYHVANPSSLRIGRVAT